MCVAASEALQVWMGLWSRKVCAVTLSFCCPRPAELTDIMNLFFLFFFLVFSRPHEPTRVIMVIIGAFAVCVSYV